MDKVCNWGNQFIKTQYFEALTEEQKENSESIVLSFTEHMYVDHRLTPEKWNESALQQVCLHTLPEMMVTGESYFTSMAPVLSAFFEFLAENQLVKSASGLAKKVREIDQQIVQNALNPENWNIGKTVFMEGIQAGVDMTNEKERDAFLENITEGSLADTLVGKLLENILFDTPEKARKNKKKKMKRNKKEKRKKENVRHIDSLCNWIKP